MKASTVIALCISRRAHAMHGDIETRVCTRHCLLIMGGSAEDAREMPTACITSEMASAAMMKAIRTSSSVKPAVGLNDAGRSLWHVLASTARET